MKTGIFTLCLVTLFFQTSLLAKIRRVGFTDVPPVSGVDYTSFYLAYQAAVNNDTIYVFPGKTLGGPGWEYSNYEGRYYIYLSKKITLISKGNWLDSSSVPKGNTGLQASKGTGSFFGNVVFQPGSDGSLISGFDGQGFNVFIEASNITIKRNYNLIITLNNLNVSNLLIEGNYRVWFTGVDNVSNVYTNMIIRNNFVYQMNLPLKSYSGVIENNSWAYDFTGGSNGGPLAMSYFNTNLNYCGYTGCNESNINLRSGTWLFQNNLMIFLLNTNAATNINNFVITGAENSTLNYNVALQSNNVSSWPGRGTGNTFIDPANAAGIFEGFPAIGSRSSDSRYILKAGSPASRDNRPGSSAEAGMFGGTTPYKLSTIPAIPTIYMISSAVNGNSIDINFSTRSNN